MFKLNGAIKVIGEKVQVSDKFAKRDVVLSVDDNGYEQLISVQFTQDRCDVLNSYAVGQQVEVSINIKGREWTSPQGEVKYFNTIEGWKIEALSVAEVSPTEAPQTQTEAPVDGEEPLPF